MHCEFQNEDLAEVCRTRVPGSLPGDLAASLLHHMDAVKAAPSHDALLRLRSISLTFAPSGRHAIGLDDEHELIVDLGSANGEDIVTVMQIAARESQPSEERA